MNEGHSYLEMYNKNKTALEKEAFDVLVNDLLRDFKFGAAKQREVSGMDMESKSPGIFVPSMFYTFLYLSEKAESAKGEVFYDRVPLIFCVQSNGSTVTGLNMNFVPNDVRAAFLDSITSSYKEFYSDESSGSFRANDKLGSIVTNPKMLSGILGLMKSTSVKFDLSQCQRTYSIKNIRRARMIEMDMWKYIPFLNFKDAVRGMNLAKVQVEGAIDSNK